MSNYLKFLFFFFIGTSVILTSCSDDTDDPQTIVGVATTTAGFDSLVAALSKANLVSTLDDGNAEFTVFAPNNAAFASLYTSLNLANGSADLTAGDLTPILLNHVVMGEAMSGDLTPGFITTLSDGPEGTKVDAYVSTMGGVSINGKMVATADVDASNGVVHVMSDVLVPPTVVDLAVAYPDFTSLVAAASYAGLAGTLADATGTYTVFAPTDAAFATFLAKLQVTDISQVDSATVASVLLKHVIIGSNVEASELMTGSVTMANGSINVDLTSGAVINDSINVAITDIQGANGIIHVIDKVIE